MNSVSDRIVAYLKFLVTAKLVPSNWYFRDLPIVMMVCGKIIYFVHVSCLSLSLNMVFPSLE